MKRNTGSQKWRVFAFLQNTNAPLAGDAAQIVGRLSKDFAAEAATNDANPTDITNGYYEFDLTQAETNAHTLQLRPYSSTTNCVVLACPATITTVPWNSITDLPNTDVGGFSGDLVAVDNFETMLDGTGGKTLSLASVVVSGAATGLSITGTTAGVSISGGTTGIGLDINGGSASGVAVDIDSAAGVALDIVSASDSGARIQGGGLGFGLQLRAASNYAFSVLSTNYSAAGFVSSGGDGSGIVCTKNGAGYDIDADIHGVVDGACGVNTTQVATGVTTALNTSIPSSPTANSTFHYLKVIDAVLLGTTNVSGSQVQFRDRSNTIATTITYSATDGGRDTVVIV